MERKAVQIKAAILGSSASSDNVIAFLDNTPDEVFNSGELTERTGCTRPRELRLPAGYAIRRLGRPTLYGSPEALAAYRAALAKLQERG